MVGLPEVNTRFMIQGLQCVILKHAEMGHLCGYVRVPRGTRLYAEVTRVHKQFRDAYGTAGVKRRPFYDCRMAARLNVHGGLTYGMLRGYHYLLQRGYWLGFDCAHAGDIVPGMVGFYASSHGVYRDVPYVYNELALLVEQIHALETRYGR